MDPNSRCFLTHKQKELSEALQVLLIQLSAVKHKVDAINNKIKPLRSSLQNITEEIYEMNQSLKKENDTLEEYTLKLAKTRWDQTTTDLAAGHEKAAMEIYIKIMKLHEEKSLITNVLKVKTQKSGELLKRNNPEEAENKKCVKSSQIIEAEDLAAHLYSIRLKNQEKLSDAKKHNCILQKRNAATLLRMRKNLLESERDRKKLEDRRNELFKNIL